MIITIIKNLKTGRACLLGISDAFHFCQISYLLLDVVCQLSIRNIIRLLKKVRKLFLKVNCYE